MDDAGDRPQFESSTPQDAEPRPLFETLTNYRDIVSGIHLNLAPRVRPPALAWHLSFWSAARLRARQDIELSRAARRRVIDGYLHAVWKSILGLEGQGVSRPRALSKRGEEIYLLGSYINRDGRRVRFDSTEARNAGIRRTGPRSVTFKFFYFGARCTIVVTEHTEYTTLTVLMDLSPIPPAEPVAPETGAVSIALQALRELDAQLRTGTEPSAETTQRITNQLHHATWKAFHDTFLVAGKPSASLMGGVLADFRGLILGSPDETAGLDGFQFQPPKWRHDPELGTGEPPPPQRRRQQKIDKAFSLRRKVDQFWRYITSDEDGSASPDEPARERYQYTISSILDGQGLYGSSLGVQPAEAGAKAPVRYFIYSNTHNGWQLGRLVDQFHHLGTVRLASVKEFEPLQNAAYGLRSVEDELLKLRQTTQEDRQKLGESTSPVARIASARAFRTPTPDVERMLLRHRQQLARVLARANASLAGIDAEVDGGVSYRIDRSEYYKAQFENGRRTLRIERIEGFRPYDKFVLRGLHDAMDFMSSLGSQAKRLFAIREGLVRYEQLVEGELTAIETAKSSNEIKSIQELADFALWVVLAPYYIGSFWLRDVLAADAHFGLFHVDWCMAVIWAGLALPSSLRLSYRGLRRRKLQFSALAASFAVVLAVACLTLGVPQIWRHRAEIIARHNAETVARPPG